MNMVNQKIYQMDFSKIYSLLVNKAEKKGRTRNEVNEIICWLTGYSQQILTQILEEHIPYASFFQNAPQMNPNRKLITGVVCGIRVEDIDDPLMQDIRYLDKLVDELARGKSMEKILRKPNALQWKCPRCGKIFQRKGQSHYCGEKPQTIEQYISMQDENKQIYLSKIYKTLKEAIPEAEERMSWSMPTFWKKQNIIHFAAAKNHIGLYPGEEAIEAFSEQLRPYHTSKGTIQIPYTENLPLVLIQDIAKWCFQNIMNDL